MNRKMCRSRLARRHIDPFFLTLILSFRALSRYVHSSTNMQACKNPGPTYRQFPERKKF